MQPQEAQGLAQFLLNQLEHEWKTTHRVLAAVPDDKCAFKPHDTSMSAQELAAHIAFVDMWFVEAVVKGAFATPEDKAALAMKPSELAAAYAARMPELLAQARQLSPEHLAQTMQFHSWNLPAVLFLNFCIAHSIHHRGQLSVYLRPMGAKVPAIYGGSADEPMTAAATEA